MGLHITSRHFLNASARSIMDFGTAVELLHHHAHASTVQSKVAVIKNVNAISDINVCNQTEARCMIDRGLAEITGKNTAKEVWSVLGVTASDVVGIKVNCNNARFALHAHPELVYALCDSLSEVVSPNNIIIYERYSRELTRAGFTLNDTRKGIRCKGAEHNGFHNNHRPSIIITDTCTKLINFPSLKTFEGDFAGTHFLKNHIGSLSPSHKPGCHGNAEMCTAVTARETIRRKTILGASDGLRGTYTANKQWYLREIILSSDEFTALSIINEKRRDEKAPDIEIPRYVRLAESKYNLGTVAPSKMNVITTMM